MGDNGKFLGSWPTLMRRNKLRVDTGWGWAGTPYVSLDQPASINIRFSSVDAKREA